MLIETGGRRMGKTAAMLEYVRRWQIANGGKPEARMHVFGFGRHAILRPAEVAEFTEAEPEQICAPEQEKAP